MNRLISTNLNDVSLDRLPPARREDRVRMLFMNCDILGFKTAGRQIKRYTDRHDQVDAVHIDLKGPLWMKVMGKSLPIHGGWDMHQMRYLYMWGWLMNRWFHGPLPLERFDVVHIMSQVFAWSVTKQPIHRPPKFVVHLDSTAVLEVSDCGASRIARYPFRRAEQRMFDRADLVIAESQWCAQSVKDDYHVPDERLHIARNSLAIPDVHRWSNSVSRPDNPMVRAAFVGNQWWRKGGDLVLEAHQKCLADTVELHVFGTRTKVDESARNVVWHGFIDREVLLNELLPTMDVFVLASRLDMLPWAGVEAASIGLPIVAPRLAGLKELVVDGKTGALFEPGNSEDLAHAWREVAADASLRERMGRAAQRHLAENFNPDREYMGMLNRLVALANEDGSR